MTVPVFMDTLRHPDDPDPVRSTKAVAVLVLGIVAVVTAPLVGGVAPAVLALVLARQARGELVAGAGYLTGGHLLRIGVNLAWIAVLLAAFVLVLAAVVGLLSLAPGVQDFDSYIS